MYYATIRRYKTNEDVTFEEIRPALNRLIPLIRERVMAYYVLDAGDGVFATISICEDEQKVETTNRVITEWLKQYLASSIVSQEEAQNLSLEVEDPLVGPFTKRSQSLCTSAACNYSRFKRSVICLGWAGVGSTNR
jgi:hypothetical protein